MSDNITVYLNVYKHNDDENNQPHYRGKIDIDGQNYSLSLWTNADINGVPINLSGQITKDGAHLC